MHNNNNRNYRFLVIDLYIDTGCKNSNCTKAYCLHNEYLHNIKHNIDNKGI